MGRMIRLLGTLSKIDPRDVFAFAGLGLLAYGLSLVCVPAAFIVPGCVLLYMAIFGSR
jgi:hypothetical protein